MEKTNGCKSDGEAVVNATNHADASQEAQADKPQVKLLITQGRRTLKHSPGSSKNSRSRRKMQKESPAPVASLPVPEVRAKRSVATVSSPSKAVTDHKPTKLQSLPTTSTSSHTDKKASHITFLGLQPPTLSTDSHEVIAVKSTKRSNHLVKFVSPTAPLTPRRYLKRSAPKGDSSNPRLSKRVRLQHHPFQSPSPPALIPAILRQAPPKTPDDKICVFQKGEFLAVRNENGSFFVCRTAQNVYKSSKRFKIQWMSDQDPDVYVPDFYDQTDFECVLTNLRLKRLDKNKYQLPGEERQRTMNILQRAMNVENGIDISKFQVTTDGVDVSIVGKEEEVLRLQEQQNAAGIQKQSPTASTSSSPRAPQLRNRGRPRQSRRRSPEAISPPSAVIETRRVKTLAARVKLRSRETVKVKLKKEGGRVIVSNKVKKVAAPKLKQVAERLHPNANVTVYERDPTFELNIPIPYVSSSAHSKLLIRAIKLKDINMLKSLMKDTQHICSLDCYRSVDVKLTPLACAVLEEDHLAMKCLISCERKKYANAPETLLEYHSNQRANPCMLGFAVRNIQMSRGGREGNNAFLKDSDFCYRIYPEADDALIKNALCSGVSAETLNILCPEDNQTGRHAYCEKDEILRHIIFAIRNGHCKLAGELVTEAVTKGGYGFGNLHKEVLTKVREPLSPFKAISVMKKAIGKNSGRVTPLHCSAINPNPQYLAALLASCHEYSLADENGWRLIHYAAACKSTGPLELLFARGVSVDDVESEGNTCLHVASSSGRAHNVDIILKHLKAMEGNKTDTAIEPPLLDKTDAAMMDRGNKKSFAPIHLACQNGFVDVARILLQYKANIDKQTNAQHEKMTPLMLAAQKGHLDIVRLLIEDSARVEMKDKKQRTALTHAVINGHAHVCSFLLRLGANPNTTDSSGNTLVHYAAAYGWYFCLKLLVEAGASLNLPNDWKITPLSLAFMKGHMGLVDFLVEQPGIDINVDVHNDSGMTLVMQALRSRINHSMLERIHFLVVKQNSDCSKLDFTGNNALHHLVLSEVEEMKIEKEAQQEHDALIQEIAKLLLNKGCDPMTKNKESESPFIMAVKEGCLLLVKLFLEAGCKLSIEVNSSGDNILHYLVSHACSRKVEPMLQAILNAKCLEPNSTPHQLLCQMSKMYNRKGHTPLLQALIALKNCKDVECKNRLLSFCKFLLDELGADVASPCRETNGGKAICYALHLATQSEGSSVIETLLSHKAPLNSLDADGQTPLILAIKQGNVEAIEALVRAGASVNMKSTRDGNLSPLLLASKSRKLGKVVQLLVHNKADVNDIDPENKNTALHYVVSLRAPDVLETAKSLLSAGANVIAVNSKLRTPLHLSVNASSSDSNASYAVEECLLGFGAKIDTLDCRGRLPLHYAFTKIGKHTDISPIDPMELVVLLVDAMPSDAVELPDSFGRTVLHCAAFRGATISSMHIAKQIKDLDIKDKDGNTALGLAVKNGHESCTLMLLQRGASCIANLFFTPENREFGKKGASPWEWKHVAKKTPVIKKHTILQETLQKDWQGILYLMLDQLEAIGKGINIAVEAALRTSKYNVALKLIGKVKHGWTLYSEKQSMLHVLAREAPGTYLPDVQVKVAQFLIEKTVPVMARDEHGCSSLTYASMNWNYSLCSFFSSKMGLSAAAHVDADHSFRTPLSAIFWKLTDEDLPEDMRNWCISLSKSGGNLNILTRYPIHASPFPGVSCLPIEGAFHVEDACVTKISPLIMAIRKRNYSVVKFLIGLGADANYPDEQLITPLMHAAIINDIRMVKLLLNNSYEPLKDKLPFQGASGFQKTSSVDLNATDAKGWSVIHHLVCPLPDYCYSDFSVLHLLSGLGASLETVNKDGESPLAMAQKLKRDTIVTALHELLKIPQMDTSVAPSDVPSNTTAQFEKPPWDYVVDFEAMLQKCADAEKETSDDAIDEYPPDPLSKLGENGEVLMDSNKSIPYDVLMTVVDLNYGAYGIYNFYKMQIIKHPMKELFVLFTSWGRVGDIGQHQNTPFGSLIEASKEFCRIFKSKTGNNWDDILNFQPQPKKYRLVQLEKRKVISKKIAVKLDLDYSVPSKQCDSLKKLFKDVLNVNLLQESLQSAGIDAAFDMLPFGKLTDSVLDEAQDILTKIGDVIAERNSLPQNAKSQDKFSDLMHEIVKLSEDFYQLLPIYGHQYERLCPLFCESNVSEKLTLIDDLLHIGLASRMLLASLLKMNETNPVDYIYKSLNCQLIPLTKDEQEAQMILQYVHNTALSKKVSVECIYKIARPSDSSSKSSCSSKKYLLWHGTRLANVISILSRGLRASPLGASMSGNLFGKGIYLADMFAKSQSYCRWDSSTNRKCMFLCEAEVGVMKEMESHVVVDQKEKLDSIKVLGRRQPNPAECISWNGVIVPLGHPINALEQDNSIQHHYLDFNEYVIYESSRVTLRYLIQFNSNC